MSHVIPPHVFQVLKSHRWNCNVLGRRRKFGHPNYVRVLGCEARGSNSCVRSSAQHTLHDARDASTRMHICGPTHRIMDQRAQTAPTRQHDHMHQLKYRLSRTRKPKSHPSSNTQCPIIPKLAPTNKNADFPAPESRKATLPATRSVHPHSWSQPTKTPTFPHQHNEKSTLQQHVVSYNPITPQHHAA